MPIPKPDDEQAEQTSRQQKEQEIKAEIKEMQEARRRRIEEAKEQCGLTEVGRRILGQLSKGYRQRVGLAQAVMHWPPILLLDEPTNGLDPQQIAEIRGLIREVGRERTVLLSSHGMGSYRKPYASASSPARPVKVDWAPGPSSSWAEQRAAAMAAPIVAAFATILTVGCSLRW